MQLKYAIIIRRRDREPWKKDAGAFVLWNSLAVLMKVTIWS